MGRIRAAIFFWSFVLAQAVVPALLPAENKVLSVSVNEAEAGDSAVVLIESHKPLQYIIRQTADPPQILVQLQEELVCQTQPEGQFSKRLVKGVRFVCKQDRTAVMDAIAIDLSRPCIFTSSQKEWFLSISLQKSDHSQPALESSPTYPSAPSSSYDNPGMEPPGAVLDEYDLPLMTLSQRPTLDEFVNVGLTNHRPLMIAQKELKLARRKLLESRRNFFPTLSARGVQSEGATQSDPNDPSTRADFRRKEIGLEIGQALFQSGRIYYSEKQARVQREIAELQVEKITLEMTFDIIKSVNNYLQMRETLNLRRALQKDSAKIVELTQRKKEIGVASESEYLGVLSAGNQIDYKVLSTEKDLELSKTKVLSLLSLESLPNDIPANFDDSLLKSAAQEFKLDNLMSAAFVNRPEIRIAQLSKQYCDYGGKIARANKLLKIDASGFIGQSGASFGQETLTLKESYNIGLRGTLYFGGSSLNPVMSNEKTAPDLGSTSRTETRAQSVTLGILDSLSVGSDHIQAVIEKEKAGEDFRKAKRDILLEVKEAFFNYQKAKYQIESAKREVEYRRKEAGIAIAKDKLHQIEAPQILQALSSLTEAEIGLKEALGFYRISLAALDKATGTRQMAH